MIASKTLRALLRPALTAVALTVALAACSSTASTATPEPSPSVSSPAGGNAEVTTWAGEVCTSASQLETSITGLAGAAAAGGGDVKGALETQAAAITTAATNLVDTVKAVPNGSEDDPQLSAINDSADALSTSVDAVEQSVTTVQAAGDGAATLAALVGVATTSAAALTALTTTTEAIKAAAQDTKGTLGQAFAANPSCASLTI